VLGTGPRATPVVAGRLFTLGINGLLTCYGVEDGKRIWQVDLYKHFQATLPGFAVCCSPLVIGNRVIVSVGGKGRCIAALNTENGEVVWQSLDDDASTSSGVLFAGNRAQAGVPDVVFLTPLRLIGLDPVDGSLRWEHAMVFQPQGTSPTPVALGDKVIASTQAHGAVAVQVAEKDDKLTTTAAWQNKELKSYFSSGVSAGELLVLVTNALEPLPTTALTGVDAATGKELPRVAAPAAHPG
jgi:outer membrane protein assembly factor BamB